MSETPIQIPCTDKNPCWECKHEITEANRAYLERELAATREELSRPNFCCGECGSLGPFEDIVYPASPNGPEEYDIKCGNCGSLDIHESAHSVLMKWKDEKDDAIETLAATREELATLRNGDLESDSIVASCSCMTKTNEARYHKPGCKYRLITERDEAREELARLKTLADAMAEHIKHDEHCLTWYHGNTCNCAAGTSRNAYRAAAREELARLKSIADKLCLHTQVASNGLDATIMSYYPSFVSNNPTSDEHFLEAGKQFCARQRAPYHNEMIADIQEYKKHFQP